VTTWAGRVATGYANVHDADALEKVEDDLFIEAARAVYPELDVSVPEAWNLPAGWSGTTPGGSDVVIGIVDLGIDPAHPSLRTATGSTRILKLWDQRKPGAAAPPIPRPYGSEWDQRDIDKYLPTGAKLPARISQHGTAVAGVAASNGLCVPAGRYVGVAPDADLVVVALNASSSNFAATNNVIDAIDYVFRVADALGKRAVVNLSQGDQLGSHDSTGELEQGISGLLVGDDRIVVTSMGNLGQAGAHARVLVPDGGITDVKIDVPDHVGPFVIADVWFDVADTLGVQVIDPAGQNSSNVEYDLGYQEGLGSDNCRIRFVPNVPHVGDNKVQIELTTVHHLGDVSAGAWTLRLTGRHVPSGQPVHGWLTRGKMASTSFTALHADPDCTATSPAAADEILPVGAYSGSGRLYSLSGRGPDRRGRALAGLAAPGDPVMSCMADPFYPASSHVSDSGTSYAAAHVAGAVAVLLQAQPTLTRKQVLDCLLRNARADADTVAGPTTGWGAGKLDIHAALRCATGNAI
jgi:subtilisin family serine protease